jgi:hypothetical protein
MCSAWQPVTEATIGEKVELLALRTQRGSLRDSHGPDGILRKKGYDMLTKEYINIAPLMEVKKMSLLIPAK